MVTARTKRLATSVLGRLLVGTIMLSTGCLVATRATAATTPTLYPHVRTNRGCLETGDDTTFAVGETVIVFLSIGSSTFSTANATLFAIKPYGFVTAIGLGAIPTNTPFALAARVGSPAGVHTLQLKASAGGMTRWRSCSFHVVSVATTPTPRPSASVTRTPTPTRTPTITSTTPSTALQPHVTTSRGCRETGDDPTYVVGEVITVSYGIDSDVVPFARATLFDIAPGGFVTVLRNRTVETNLTFSFKATVAPPTGVETLKLRASAFGVSSVSSFCSFSVVYAPPG